VVGSAAWPAAQVYNLPPVRRARAQTAQLTAALARDGHAVIDRAGVQARATAVEAARQFVAAILNDPATEALVEDALASNEMQLVLERVTGSPELRAALARQTAGLAGDVAAGVRSRTVSADARSERVAQQVMRRLRGVTG